MSVTHDEDFDRRMRSVHARALAEVPSRTLYELRVRRANAASAATAAPSRRSGGWLLAGGLAAAFALAVGLRQPDPGPQPAGDAGTPALAATSDAAEAAAWDDGLAALDEDPDLYLWLASQDSLILAME